MSSQEAREARRKRQTRGARSTIHHKAQKRRREDHFSHHEHAPGPRLCARSQEKWSEDYAGEDPHDDEYFQDRELDFNE